MKLAIAPSFMTEPSSSATPTIAESFAWDPALSALRLGVNYVGLMDDVMVFNRALKPEEIKKLGKCPRRALKPRDGGQ
jgi:hypothetical protein